MRKLNLDENEIENLYLKKKKNSYEIADILNVCATTIRRILKKNGVNLRTKRLKLDEKKIIDLYVNQKKPANEISKLFNVSVYPIYRILREQNIRIRKGKELDNKKIKDLYVNQRKTIRKIGKLMDVSESTILDRLKKIGIKIKKNGNGRKKISLNLKKIKDLYVNQKMPSSKIAKIFNVNEVTINKRLEEMNIARRKNLIGLDNKEIKRLYVNEKKSTREIAKILKANNNTILLRLKTIGVKRRTNSEARKGKKCPKLTRILIKRWQNPIYREKQIRLILNGLMKRPTSYEKKISELCIENSLPFIYSGDGKFLINFKNPDFVNHKDKVIIEVFYSYFKIRDYGSVENYKEFCKRKYNPAGWKVIFIDENEVDVKNWKELCLNKISAVADG